MITIQRSVEGYSESCLVSFQSGLLFYPSWTYGKQIPVRGLAFAAGTDSTRLASEFAQRHLGLGVIGLRMDTMTIEAWRGVTTLLVQHQAEVSRVGFLLHALDLTMPGLHEEIADTIDRVEGVAWLATAGDPLVLHPKLRLPFLVYLGLGQTGRMRFLLDKRQQLAIDKGSMKKAGE
jgi:hypothetical protein